MPIYGFRCDEHGEFELIQRMVDDHIAICPQCKRMAIRIFYPAAIHGNLPGRDLRPGKTRGEMFDNMAKEGFHDKNWREQDEYEQKRARDAGIKYKPMVGWTPKLGI